MTILATTHDSIYQGERYLEQPAKGYRFGSDAMLLAGALQARTGQKVLELGCGVGAVLLAAQHRIPDVFFTGIEREAEYVDLAKKNVFRNEAANRISIFQGDLRNNITLHSLGTFDHILANPPYYETGTHSGAMTDLRRVARQHAPGDLAEWMQTANRLLKPKGTVTFIHSAEKMDELVTGLKRFCGNIRIFPFWPRQGEMCKRLIVQGTKGSRAPLLLMPGLVLHEEDGLTARAFAVINEGAPLWE